MSQCRFETEEEHWTKMKVTGPRDDKERRVVSAHLAYYAPDMRDMLKSLVVTLNTVYVWAPLGRLGGEILRHELDRMETMLASILEEGR